MVDMVFFEPMTASLLLQHKALVTQRIQPLARGQVVDEQVYQSVLQGIANASKISTEPIFNHFYDWESEISSSEPRKKVLMYLIFFESLRGVVEAAGNLLSEKQFDSLERWSIDWLLLSERDHTLTEHREFKEMVTYRASLLLGSIGDHHLVGITQKYLREVDDRLPKDTSQSRQEIKQLCEGMQHIRLATNSTAQLEAATDFLRKCDPLRHTAPQRKSYVHHTMCEMLTAILGHMINEDRPRGQADILDPNAMIAWQNTVRKLRGEIASWTRQSKHISVAYPLITLLFSLEDDKNFAANIDSQMELIMRNLRDKDRRKMALDCIHLYFQAYLRKIAPTARIADVSAFLGKHTKVLLSHLKKGSFHQQEQHDMMVTICVTIIENAPEYGVGNLLAELLGDAGAWDIVIVGLKALHKVIMNAPKRARRSSQTLNPDPASTMTTSDTLAEMIRNSQPVLPALGVPHLSSRISSLLHKIVISAFNNAAAPAKSKLPMESLPPPGLLALKEVLSSVPYVLPEPWASTKMTSDLAAQTLYQFDPLRLEATDVLKRIMTCLPARRNEVVVAIASYVVKISDEFQDGLKRMLGLWLGLMSLWITILDEKQRGTIQETDVPDSRRLDLHRLEGIAISMMAISNADMRKQALEILRTLRTLHRSLLASARCLGIPEVEPVNYMFTIIENVSTEKAQQCFWSFSQWADLWRVWRPVKDERAPAESVSLQSLMSRTTTQEDLIRWARTISEIIKTAARLSPRTANAAFVELTSRAQLHMVVDNMGRLAYAMSTVDTEQWRVDLICGYAMAALACPPQAGPKGGISSRDLIAALLVAVRAGNEAHQQALIVSLGYCHQECAEILLEELQPLVEEYLTERSKPTGQHNFLQNTLAPGSARRQPKNTAMEGRIQVAQMLRILAGNAQPGFLHKHPVICKKMVDFISETRRFLHTQPEASWMELATIRYCLCCVVRAVCTDFIGAKDPALSVQVRGGLFDLISQYCLEGSKGQSQRDMLKANASARAKMRSDVEFLSKTETEIADLADNLEHMAHLAMASLLWGVAFESDISKQQCKVLTWIENMLSGEMEGKMSTDSERARLHRGRVDGRWGPSKEAVARTALRNLLSTNPQALNVSIDQSYSKEPAVARTYFQVLVEVYASKDLQIEPQILLSLVLYKMVDPELEVRDDALHMLRVLSMRVWKEGLVPPRPDTETTPNPSGNQEEVAVVVGNLQDTYQQFQYHVSAKLAREHPEISEGLCIEMMTRQLAASLSDARFHSLQHHILTALTPWMENITFRLSWKGNWSERLMKSMYYVTQLHGVSFPHEIERLWCTVAANKRNVIPILEFLISKPAHESISQDSELPLNIFDVEKRISLYLARTSPQQTIDHLNYEITQLIEADDEPVTAHKPASLVEYQFHDPDHSPRRQTSHSSQHGKPPWHTKSASLSQVPSIGHSGLTDLSAMPSSLIPEFMPDVSQIQSHSASASREGHKMSDLLRSVSSARQNVAESLHSSSSEFERRLDSRSSPARGPLMRAEVAVCLLAEIAYEHDEDFRGHLPLLFHAMLLLMDSTDSLVFRHAQQVISHLLYSLSVRHLELHRAAGAMLAEYEKVTSLLTYLQAMRGKRLWNYEDVTMQHIALSSTFALTALTSAIVESIFFEKDIKDRWAKEALKWMLDSNSRHLACRSHQIFRALRPAPSSTAFISMFTCLEKCLTLSNQLSLEVAVEVILTLQVMVENLEPKKMLLYPQLFLACLALLPTTFRHVYALAIDLFLKILEKLDLNNTTTQHIILAASPLVAGSAMPQLFGSGGRSNPINGVPYPGRSVDGWPLSVHLYGGSKKYRCIQQLLVKGLFRPETELCTIEAMACIADQIACLRSRQKGGMMTVATLVYELPGAQTHMSGLGALLGEVETQLALSIISQLPWLCQHFRYSVHAGLAALSVVSHARACRAAGYKAMGDALIKLRRTNPADLRDILREICTAYTQAFFPTYAKLALQRLMEAILKGKDPASHGYVLQILCAIFEAPGLDLGSNEIYTNEEGLLSPVARLIQGEHSADALKVINAISLYPRATTTPDLDSQVILEWPKYRDGSDDKIMVEGLSRLNKNWSHSNHDIEKNKFMPFLPPMEFHAAKPTR